MKLFVTLQKIRFITTSLLFVVLFSCCSCQKEQKHNRYHLQDHDPYSSTMNPHYSAFGLYLDDNKHNQVATIYMISAEIWMRWNTIQTDDSKQLIIFAVLAPDDWNKTYIRSIWLCLPYDNIQIGEQLLVSDSNNAIYGYDEQGNAFYYPLSSINLKFEKNSEGIIRGLFSSELEVADHSYSIDNGIFYLVGDAHNSDFSYEDWLNFNRGTNGYGDMMGCRNLLQRQENNL